MTSSAAIEAVARAIEEHVSMGYTTGRGEHNVGVEDAARTALAAHGGAKEGRT